MSSPFYVSPEQVVGQDKAEYARKGIARASRSWRSSTRRHRDDGREPSATLRKIAEIYDRIAFAGVGKFDEYESLRKHGRALRGPQGVHASAARTSWAKSLANEYSTLLGRHLHARDAKPYEVEILVAEVGDDRSSAY